MSSLARVPATPEGAQPVAPQSMSTSDPELLKWQRNLLPLMTRFIVGLAVVFFLFSAVHVYQVAGFIQTEHEEDIRKEIADQIKKPAGQQASGEEVLQNSLLLLEADTLDKRYHQASALLLSRIWSRQMAFIIGMVMAFLGAIFILGKMTESTSNITGEGSQWKVGISSASPGIILSFFGTILLITTLLIKTTLDLSDGPAYVTALRRAAAASTATPAASPASGESIVNPLNLDDMKKLSHDQAAGEKTPDGKKK